MLKAVKINFYIASKRLIATANLPPNHKMDIIDILYVIV